MVVWWEGKCFCRCGGGGVRKRKEGEKGRKRDRGGGKKRQECSFGEEQRRRVRGGRERGRERERKRKGGGSVGTLAQTMKVWRNLFKQTFNNYTIFQKQDRPHILLALYATTCTFVFTLETLTRIRIGTSHAPYRCV